MEDLIICPVSYITFGLALICSFSPFRRVAARCGPIRSVP